MNTVTSALTPECGSSHIRVQHIDDPATAPLQWAQWIADDLQTALAQRGRAVLAVSGGKSPIPMFEAMSRIDIDWPRVVVTLVDDRQVSENHEASNARLVRGHLLCHHAAAARLVSMVGPDLPDSRAGWRDRAAQAHRELLSLGPADVTVLGMGLDGHFASLFAHADELSAALDPMQTQACMAMHLRQPPPEAPFDRISQTLAHIVRSRRCVLTIAGSAKWGVLQQAWSHPGAQWPISALLHASALTARTPLSLWTTP
jgi:6-phosphogluconolactonase